MRDSSLLRLRLATLAALPLLAAAGCDSPPAPQKAEPSKAITKADRKAERRGRLEKMREAKRAARAAAAGGEGDSGGEAKADAKVEERDRPSTPEGRGNHATPAPPPEAASDPRYLPIPGDPPHVDGYNPEEETCPSGNWCGTKATAAAIAPQGDASPEVMGCPPRIVGAHDPSPITGAVYAGLSAKRQMQGAFNEGRTTKWRKQGKADACCYHWFEYCSGRPLMDGTGSVVAPARGDAQWLDETVIAGIDGLDDDVRRLLASAWLDDALREHASIASFARAATELLAVGAPPDLVEACMRAATDEVDHARRCFALASVYGGREVGPGPLPAVAPRQASLVELVESTFLEGCVGETVATLIAERSLAVATDEAVRGTLRVIAEDEARHAALAWRTVAWALGQGGVEVAALLLDLLERAPQVEGDGGTRRSARMTALLQAHGRLPDHVLARTVDDAWNDIIAPMLRALLGQGGASSVPRA